MWPHPATRASKVHDDRFGRRVTDKFRWLEGDSPEVAAWVDAQNAFTLQTLRGAGAPITPIADELSKFLGSDLRRLPSKKAGMYYWEVRSAGQKQWTFVTSERYDDPSPTVLVNPNLHADGSIALKSTNVSPSGTYLAYALSSASTETGTIHVRNLLTGKELPADTIPHSRQAIICWLDDESGFFYDRNPEPGTVAKGDEHYHSRIYFHRLGDDWRNDQLIFGEGRHKEDMYHFNLACDGKILIIRAWRNWTENSIYLYDMTTKVVTTVVEGDGVQYKLRVIGRFCYAWTDSGEGYGQVLRAPVEKLGANLMGALEPFIPERGYKLVDHHFTAEGILVRYLRDACSYVEILDYSGRLIGTLDLPPCSSLSSIVTHSKSAEIFFGVSSFVAPMTVCRMESLNAKPVRFYRRPIPLDPDQYTVTQEWCESTGGVRVPMFVIRKSGLKLNGNNPTLLFGYGAHGISQTPKFYGGFAPFLERDGVFVVVNVRGGGEFGEEWHRAGILENKQNSFDDFIAAARWLIAAGYTSPERLAAYGGSSGSLLTGVCAVQAPELFKALVCSVPLADMVRFPHFLIASRWKSEFGDPGDAQGFGSIINWSPYHNFDPTRKHPAMFFNSASRDTRVHPLHARKMCAQMQAAGQEAPVLLYTDQNAGHGPGKPLNKFVDTRAHVLSFLFWQLGML